MNIFSYKGDRLHHLQNDLYATAKSFNDGVYIHIRTYVPSASSHHKLVPTKKGVMLSIAGFEKLIGSSTALLVEAAGIQSQLPAVQQPNNLIEIQPNDTKPLDDQPTDQPTGPRYEFDDPEAIRQYLNSLYQ